MKNLKNEQGIALVTALCLTLISLAIVMALLYIVTWQTRLSGAHKRYKTALEASQGGAEIFAKQIIPMVFNGYTTALRSGASLGATPGNIACLSYKLQNATTAWSAVCGTDAAPFDPTKSADVVLTLQGASSSYNVYTKIVDSVPGNSDRSGFDYLLQGGGADWSSPDVSPKHIPAMYRIEIQGQASANPAEKAQLSVLYAY